MSNFRPIQRDVDYLFPPSMRDWLPEHHLARFVVEIVEQLDLKEMERAYGSSGSAAFHSGRSTSSHRLTKKSQANVIAQLLSFRLTS